MDDGERLAIAAAQLIGVPFRLHGCDPETGLDCVGLLAASLRAIGHNPIVPRGYRLKNHSADRWLPLASVQGFEEISRADRSGDIILTKPSTAQYHLMILADRSSVIHAHASLGRVVRQPLPSPLHASTQWRLNSIVKG